MKTCSHFFYMAATSYPAADYVLKEFGIEFGHTPGAYAFESGVLRILNQHFQFHGPVAFAPDEKAREAASKAVEDFLRARMILK